MKQHTYTQKVKLKLLLTKFFSITLGGIDIHCIKISDSSPTEEQTAMVEAFRLLSKELRAVEYSQQSDYQTLKATLALLSSARVDLDKGVEYTVAADELYTALTTEISKKGLKV